MTKDEMARMDALGDQLVDATDGLRRALVDLRRQRTDLDDATIAARTGCSVAQVRALEAYDADPRLSELRRYALAIGAGIAATVTDALGEEDPA